MRQYPIWNVVQTVGGKKSPAHFGASESFRQIVYVGTGSTNSHELVKIEVKRHEMPDGSVDFTLYVDGVMVKYGLLSGTDYTPLYVALDGANQAD